MQLRALHAKDNYVKPLNKTPSIFCAWLQAYIALNSLVALKIIIGHFIGRWYAAHRDIIFIIPVQDWSTLSSENF